MSDIAASDEDVLTCKRGHDSNWHVRKDGSRFCRDCQKLARKGYTPGAPWLAAYRTAHQGVRKRGGSLAEARAAGHLAAEANKPARARVTETPSGGAVLAGAHESVARSLSIEVVSPDRARARVGGEVVTWRADTDDGWSCSCGVGRTKRADSCEHVRAFVAALSIDALNSMALASRAAGFGPFDSERVTAALDRFYFQEDIAS